MHKSKNIPNTFSRQNLLDIFWIRTIFPFQVHHQFHHLSLFQNEDEAYVIFINLHLVPIFGHH